MDSYEGRSNFKRKLKKLQKKEICVWLLQVLKMIIFIINMQNQFDLFFKKSIYFEYNTHQLIVCDSFVQILVCEKNIVLAGWVLIDIRKLKRVKGGMITEKQIKKI